MIGSEPPGPTGSWHPVAVNSSIAAVSSSGSAASSPVMNSAAVSSRRGTIQLQVRADDSVEAAQLTNYLAGLRFLSQPIERLLESETWRGLATHRDLVKAHQQVRALEAQAAAGEILRLPAVGYADAARSAGSAGPKRWQRRLYF